MNAFPVTTACVRAGAAFPQRFEALRTRINAVYSARSIRATANLDRECAFFLNWCVEIAGRNSQPNWLDEWRAKRTFSRQLRGSLAPFSLPGRDNLRELENGYHGRYRDALATMWNIYLQRDPSGRLEMPMTRRTAKLFLRHSTTATGSYPAEAVADVHDALAGTLEQHAAAFFMDAAA